MERRPCLEGRGTRRRDLVLALDLWTFGTRIVSLWLPTSRLNSSLVFGLIYREISKGSVSDIAEILPPDNRQNDTVSLCGSVSRYSM